MAERSTAAVDVADTSGDEPLTAQADQSTADGVANNRERDTDSDEAQGNPTSEEPGKTSPPELHSGHKLARRYRLEECVTRLDGFSSWRAVDEKLRRAVGVHLLPADHARARSVLAAARSSALLGDPRFVQVLDAVEDNDLVYVVHEWLPDATELTALLAAGPLEVYDAYQMVSQVASAMAAAHREGLAHLRLSPNAVLRTSTGQWRIRGLAVNAALRGISSDTPQRTDTEAIGALLYATLTQRWPYESDAHGLAGLPKDIGLIPPDQVRAGVHRGLSELAMRALANDGATASRHESPCTTPEELVKAIGEMPRIRPPEPAYTAPPQYQRTPYQQGGYSRPAPHPGVTQPVPTPPPPLQSRTGKALKWGVSALLIAALGLGSWQLADALMERGGKADDPNQTQTVDGDNDKSPKEPVSRPISIAGAHDYDPFGSDGSEYPENVGKAYDGDPGTYWQTSHYASADFGRLKPGVGIVVDLGKVQQVGKVALTFGGDTSVELRSAGATDSEPQSFEGYQKIAGGNGTTVDLKPDKAVKTRYLLVWLTKLPVTDGQFRGRVADIKVTS
ncbi:MULTISPECIES: protein kinase family protein [Streptomyces]|uniref:Serine/threonine protein kinase n=4 Tax=Streptomyces TaxID=1883 RepID=Q9X8S9_STRCO|nr:MULTISPECIES: protein kinase family protein [Streptomyces]MYU43417.1 serine/threonine protein kinase [Streptomyces sp. SID7813]MBQ0951698.1 serine/threonine protein kinase [Streptomyces sp. RK76]MCW8117061.1 protein kinase family protein [Streptomyces anthocyanicus]MCZ4633746.1 protein kinase family protein [Streptomyces rubrogriseus]MDX2925199.1 protein kinase family protein [Streptomyces sp. NRRL_B-16638]